MTISHPLGDIKASPIQNQCDPTWDLKWKGATIGRVTKGYFGFSTNVGGLGLFETLPEAAQALLVSYLDVVKQSNPYGYNLLTAS